jgi:hypothetical protein
VPADRTGGKLPPPFAGIAKDDERRTAAAEAYQRQLASIDPDALQLDDDAPPQQPAVEPITLPAYPSAEPGRPNRPNLEPIPEQAHPAKNRRIPTQPPAAISLDLESSEASSPAGSSAPDPLGYAPPALKTVARQSPAPVRRGLFSIDRPTNLLAGAAVGLLLTVFPAKKLAESYETREVEPKLVELEKSVAQTLAVDAGLVESPESVAARIHDDRKKVRRRFMLVWLLAGVPIGVGIGLAPRPGD